MRLLEELLTLWMDQGLSLRWIIWTYTKYELFSVVCVCVHVYVVYEDTDLYNDMGMT